MKSQTDAMIAAGKAEEQLKLEEAKKPVVIDDSEVPEMLERVIPPPADDPSAFR
jgi:hypothetical protein